MGAFKDAMQALANGVKDLSSLDVVTFQGRVELDAQDSVKTFDQVMEKALGNTNIKAKVLASTQAKIDGDLVVFYDQDITSDQMDAHAKLVEIGRQSRSATIDFIKSFIDPKDL